MIKLLLRILDYIFLIFFSSTSKMRRPKRKTGKILITRTDGLGDYILWLSVVEEIKKIYPNEKIILLLDSDKPTLELVKLNPYIDDAISINIKGWKRFFSLLQMCKMKFDVIIQPVFTRTIFTDILVFSTKASVRITLDTNAQLLSNRELKWSNRGYDKIIPCSKGLKHELIRCEELVHGLGNKKFCVTLPRIRLTKTPHVQLPLKPYILIFPSGSWNGKKWETTKYVELIKWLAINFKYSIYLSGDLIDKKTCDIIRDEIDEIYKNKIYNISGKFSITEMIPLISTATLIIGNDTGVLHMAVSLRRPTIAITASRELGRFMPYYLKYNIEKKDYPICINANMKCMGCILKGHIVCPYIKNENETLPCIKKITVQMLQKAVEEVL